MANDKVLGTLKGTTRLQLEYGYKPMGDDLGTHDWTMTFYWFKGEHTGDGNGVIEWDIPTLDRTESIGIWIEEGNLTDYDGLMALPREAVTLLESCGIKVDHEIYLD